MAREVNIYTSKPKVTLTADKVSVSNIAMTITVNMVLNNGQKYSMTENCTWKALMARAKQDDLQEWLAELMIRDMTARTEKAALLAVKEVITK